MIYFSIVWECWTLYGRKDKSSVPRQGVQPVLRDSHLQIILEKITLYLELTLNKIKVKLEGKYECVLENYIV